MRKLWKKLSSRSPSPTDYSMRRCPDLPEPKYRFLFLIGASGSGTTMLTRILSYPAQVVGIGGKYISIPPEQKAAYRKALKYNDVNSTLWNRHAPLEQYLWAKHESMCVINDLLSMPDYQHITHVLHKRSAPFLFGDQHRPDLLDLTRMFPDVRIVAIYRDPCASTFSSYRREFAHNLRQAAIITSEQLTHLSAQLSVLPENMYKILSYSEYCSRPTDYTDELAEFCGLPHDELLEAAQKEKPVTGRNQRWREELSAEEIDFLDNFFSETRRKQWPLLSQVEV